MTTALMGDKERICILSCLLGMDDSHSYFYADEILKLGYPLHLICPGTIPAAMTGKAVSQSVLPLPTHHFDYHSSISDLLGGLRQRFRNSRLAYQSVMKVKPDILFCSQPDSWWVAVRAKRKLHNKVVVDLKEIYEDRSSAFPRALRPLVRKIIRFALKKLAAHTDEIIHVNKARQDYFAYLGMPGTVIAIYPSLSPIQTSRTKKKTGRINIVHAGGLRWSYASEQFIDAVRIVTDRHPETHFIVIGDQRSKLRNQSSMEKLIGEGLMEVHSTMPHEQVLNLLNDCDIGINLVLPLDLTHIFAQPRKLFEYLSVGIPVVAADVPTIREVVEGNQCGVLVDPESPSKIAEAICLLIEDEDMRQKMGENGRKSAQLTYNAENESKKLAMLIDRLSDHRKEESLSNHE